MQFYSPQPTFAQPTFRLNRHFFSVPAHFLSLPSNLYRLNWHRYNRHSPQPTSCPSPKRCLCIIFVLLQLSFSGKHNWSENEKLIKLQYVQSTFFPVPWDVELVEFQCITMQNSFQYWLLKFISNLNTLLIIAVLLKWGRETNHYGYTRHTCQPGIVPWDTSASCGVFYKKLGCKDTVPIR